MIWHLCIFIGDRISKIFGISTFHEEWFKDTQPSSSRSSSSFSCCSWSNTLALLLSSSLETFYKKSRKFQQRNYYMTFWNLYFFSNSGRIFISQLHVPLALVLVIFLLAHEVSKKSVKYLLTKYLEQDWILFSPRCPAI